MFELDAMMVDVRNGYMYLAAESEGDDAQQRAHVWIDGRSSVDAAKQSAVEHLAGELRRRFEHVLAGARPPDGEDEELQHDESPPVVPPPPPPPPEPPVSDTF